MARKGGNPDIGKQAAAGGRASTYPYMKVRAKHMRVIDAYFENGFDKKAALIACGFAETTASGNPGLIFDRDDIKAEIDRRQRVLAEKHDLNMDWVIERFKRIADANLGAVILRLEQVGDDFGQLTKDELYLINSRMVETYMHGRGEDASEVRKIKITGVSKADAIAALNSLTRILGGFDDKLSLTAQEELISALQKGRERARQKGKSDA